MCREANIGFVAPLQNPEGEIGGHQGHQEHDARAGQQKREFVVENYFQ